MSEKFMVSYVALLAITWLAVKVSASKISQFPPDLAVPGGANVTMFCTFPLSEDTVDVRWWRECEKTSLEGDSRRQFTVERGKGALLLWNVNVTDSGMYYCEAKDRERSFGRGSGSRLTVFAPPTPLEIVPIGRFSSPQKLLCKTAAFYPEKIEIVWQINNKLIHTGIKNVTNVNGLYEAFSLLEVTQSTWGKDIYTCLVSHVSLHVSASFSYILEQVHPQGADTKLILAYTVDGLAILTLIIVTVKVNLKRSHGGTVEHATACESLSMRESTGVRKDRQQEERMI